MARLSQERTGFALEIAGFGVVPMGGGAGNPRGGGCPYARVAAIKKANACACLIIALSCSNHSGDCTAWRLNVSNNEFISFQKN
jgi:hypothetical protein